MFRKWIVFIFFFCAITPYVFAYGHVADLVVPNATGESKVNPVYLSYKFIYGEQITFCTQGIADERVPFSNENLALYFQAAFLEWTRGTARYLRESGRGQEFADIIALLEKPFKLVNLGECRKGMMPSADIELTADNITVKKEYMAYYWQSHMQYGAESQIHFFPHLWLNYREQKPAQKAKVQNYIQNVLQGNFETKGIELSQITRDKATDPAYRHGYFDPLFAVMLHEVGHAFGLADENTKKRSEELGFSVGRGGQLPVRAPTGKPYFTPYQGYGLMSYNWFYRERTADDVMGLITLLDRISGKQRIIYPLLSDYNVPDVGAIVNGKYVFPPQKNTERAKKLFKKYFSLPGFRWGLLHKYGPQVFEREFSPVPGYPAKYIRLNADEQRERDNIQKQLIEQLKQEKKIY